MQYCQICKQETNCTENCSKCMSEEMKLQEQAIAIYKQLKELSGKSEAVTEEAIINDLGTWALMMLREYNLIESCGVINGNKMYAI